MVCFKFTFPLLSVLTHARRVRCFFFLTRLFFLDIGSENFFLSSKVTASRIFFFNDQRPSTLSTTGTFQRKLSRIVSAEFIHVLDRSSHFDVVLVVHVRLRSARSSLARLNRPFKVISFPEACRCLRGKQVSFGWLVLPDRSLAAPLAFKSGRCRRLLPAGLFLNGRPSVLRPPRLTYFTFCFTALTAEECPLFWKLTLVPVDP